MPLGVVVILLSCGGGDRYHPRKYKRPQVHGLAAKVQEEDCTACHGEALDGSGISGVSCDSCHPQGWRTDCTFCHGGDADATGAPPVNIHGVSADFFPHSVHVSQTDKPAYACSECHLQPTDVLSEGHLFPGDDTPGEAETDFQYGISPLGTYDPASGTCSNVYCHGNGRTDSGLMSVSWEAPTCEDCHPGPTSGMTGWSQMTGTHARHLGDRVACSDCHASVIDASNGITNPSLHVQGQADVALTNGVTWNAGTSTCNGACHNHAHVNERW